MKRLLACLLALAPLLVTAQNRSFEVVAEAANPDKRVALVIGNSKYRTQPLPNPALDAAAMKGTLEKLGFQVVMLTDADRAKSLGALAQFKTRLAGAGVGLFYFAGHGIQIEGQNYLLPVDADMGSEDQVKYNTVNLQQVLDALAETPVKLVILDACRNNPFQRTRGDSGGLAAVANAPQGTLIAYATAPGRVAKDGEAGKNGLYTSHLLKAMQETGRSIEDVFKFTRAGVAEASRGQQVPWESTSLTGRLTLKPGATMTAESNPTVALAPESQTRGLSRTGRPAQPAPLSTFRDCERCPEMVVVPAGKFQMGSPEGEAGRQGNEGPVREVSIERSLAIGRFEVTFEEWEACLLDGGCDRWPDDRGWGRGKRPVIDVSWNDANRYVTWLSGRTGKQYRLLSEAEWEYAARAGTSSARHWGDKLEPGKARCSSCGNAGEKGPVAVGSFGANKWSFADMLGNVWEWTADCYNASLAGLDARGAAATTGDCSQRSMRGGSWITAEKGVRAATRAYFPESRRASNIGFRVASAVE